MNESHPPPTNDQRAEQAFQAYCKAAERAQATKAIEDGISAGRVWAAFLSCFTSAEVVDLRRYRDAAERRAT